MKLINKFLGFGIACGAMFGFAACTNELNEQPNVNGGLGGIRLAKSADITAWSGNQFLSPGTPIGTKSISPNFSTRDGETEQKFIYISQWDSTDPNNPKSWEQLVKNQPYLAEHWDNHPLQSDNTNPEFVSIAEYKYVINYIKNHPNEGGYTCNLTTYYLQNVGTSGDSYVGEYKKEDGGSRLENITGVGHMNQLRFDTYHVDSYNSAQGNRALCMNIPVVNPRYSDSWGGEPQEKENAYKFYYIRLPKDQFEVDGETYTIPDNYAGKLYGYICFDYKTTKYDNGLLVFEGDGVFNDWVLKLTPGKGLLEESDLPEDYVDNEGNHPGDSGSTGGEDPCPNDACTHPGTHHEDGICQDCKDEGLDNPTCNPCPKLKDEVGCKHSKTHHNDEGYCDLCTVDDAPCHKSSSTGGDNGNTGGGDNNGGNDQPGNNTPSTPAKGSPKSEVEVNLSINDEHTMQGLKDLVAKLSIHIRHSEDVEIFIPVGAEHYVANDDLIILKDHQLGNFEHGGTPAYENGVVTSQSVTYVIDNHSVTLTVQFEEDGIRVTTDGMDEHIFEYLKKEFGDGLNFEVWLYFNDATENWGREELKEKLDQSTIEFLDKGNPTYPDYYINAFNDTADNQRGEKDCTVSIDDNQNELYQGSDKSFPHLNGSSYNKIYWLKNKDLPEGVHDHHFLWDYYNPNTNNSGNQENPAQ